MSDFHIKARRFFKEERYEKTSIECIHGAGAVPVLERAEYKPYTYTPKGGCVFEKQVSFSGKTQLKGGTFLRGIIVEPGEQALALLADGYAFADADTNEILNVSHVSLRRQNVKVVEHTCQ